MLAILLLAAIFGVEYHASRPDIFHSKFGNGTVPVVFETDADGEVQHILVNDSVDIFEYTLPKEESRTVFGVDLLRDGASFSVIVKGMKRKYVFVNNMLYVYYHDVSGYENDSLIEYKYTYKKTVDGYVSSTNS